jgi:hypothetical protein
LSPPRETVKSAAPQGAVAVELLERFESLKYPEKMAGDALYFIKKNLHAPLTPHFLRPRPVQREKIQSAKGLINGYSVVSRAHAPDQKSNR